MKLDETTARNFARLTLGHIGREYPYKLDHVLTGPEDARTPAELHPIFHGSFDWHSCVHGWWQLMRLARLYPGIPEAAEIAARAGAMLTPGKVAGELAYLARPMARGFERPYGWGWLLALHAELDAPYADILAPLAEAFATRFKAYLPLLTYPVRTGSHANTAFSLILARHWAGTRDQELLESIDVRARQWFSQDRDAQAWEPDGDAFLSPTLVEAMLMKSVLGLDFAAWFAAFLPCADKGEPATLFTPAHVSDRGDGKIAHLDGLNLSRCWCWRALGHDDAAERHLAASLPHVAGDYMGEHWLATFALLALDEPA
ncbi:MAG: DUF2891 domain-containing protein [Sphingomonadaceae bacterium]|nr:DUF2891 domain-containing protein [Sphingomonadaceae bacterium]